MPPIVTYAMEASDMTCRRIPTGNCIRFAICALLVGSLYLLVMPRPAQ